MGKGTQAFAPETPILIFPRVSIHTTIMELGPQSRNRAGLGLLRRNSIIAVYMDPLGYRLGRFL